MQGILMSQAIKHQAGLIYSHSVFRYLFVGGSGVILDAGSLYVLHKNLGLAIAIATSIAYWFAIIYNFTLTRFWTFNTREKEGLHKHIALYALLICVNYLVTVTFVSIASHFIYFITAKIIIVVVQTCWNYPVYKFIIFSKQ
jgi:putative flippase GtrA